MNITYIHRYKHIFDGFLLTNIFMFPVVIPKSHACIFLINKHNGTLFMIYLKKIEHV
jgi:hypothetical protein